MTNSSSGFSSTQARSLALWGRRFDYAIRRFEGANTWRLEFIDDQGKSFLWEDPFVSENAALSVARYLSQQESETGPERSISC